MADHRLKEFTIPSSRHRQEEGGSLAVDYDSGQDNASVASSVFEFHKAERGARRVPLAPFSKPAPSKWDDAQKWIASPTYNRPRNGQSQAQLVSSSRTGSLGYGNWQVTSKIVVEVPEEKFDEEEEETKRIYLDQIKKEVTWGSDPFPVTDSYAVTNSDGRLFFKIFYSSFLNQIVSSILSLVRLSFDLILSFEQSFLKISLPVHQPSFTALFEAIYHLLRIIFLMLP